MGTRAQARSNACCSEAMFDLVLQMLARVSYMTTLVGKNAGAFLLVFELVISRCWRIMHLVWISKFVRIISSEHLACPPTWISNEMSVYRLLQDICWTSTYIALYGTTIPIPWNAAKLSSFCETTNIWLGASGKINSKTRLVSCHIAVCNVGKYTTILLYFDKKIKAPADQWLPCECGNRR